jgi:Bacteriophage protein of unknown function (DUF646).
VDEAVRRARANVNSRTGALARSIEGEVRVSGRSVEIAIGSDRPEARVVEEGGPRNKPQRYLRRAVEQTEKDTMDDVADAVGGALRG